MTHPVLIQCILERMRSVGDLLGTLGEVVRAFLKAAGAVCEGCGAIRQLGSAVMRVRGTVGQG